ncbi:MAG: ZrgA family zinc uptake protein [Alteromonas oceani]
MDTHLKRSQFLPYSLVLLAAVGCIYQQVSAAEAAHVHGQGSLLIAQQENVWQLQFRLPAADIPTFEHAQRTEESADRIRELKQTLASPKKAFELIGGNCQSAGHEFDFANHEMHHHEHAKHSDTGTHSEVTLSYSLHCEQVPQRVKVNLFDIASSLELLDTQWSISAGQGKADLTPSSRSISW